MFEIGPAISLASGILQLIHDLTNPSQRKQVLDAQEKAKNDVEKFTESLLADNWANVQLMLDGLSIGISSGITADQSSALHTKRAMFNGYSIVGFYSRARAAMMLSEMLEIVRSTKPE